MYMYKNHPGSINLLNEADLNNLLSAVLYNLLDSIGNCPGIIGTCRPLEYMYKEARNMKTS